MAFLKQIWWYFIFLYQESLNPAFTTGFSNKYLNFYWQLENSKRILCIQKTGVKCRYLIFLNISSYTDWNLFWDAKSSEHEKLLRYSSYKFPNFLDCSEVFYLVPQFQFIIHSLQTPSPLLSYGIRLSYIDQLSDASIIDLFLC